MYGQNYYLPGKSSPEIELENKEIAKSIIESNYKREQQSKKLDEFKTNTKVFLLKESLGKLFKQSLPSNIEESHLDMGTTLIEKFILEEGVDNLLKSFQCKTVFLNEISNAVIDTYNSIIENCDFTDINTYTIKKSDMSKFYDKLDNIDMAKIGSVIASRVAEAEGEFITANVKDREQLEDLAQDTKDKIDSYIGKDSNITESVRKDYQSQYKQKVNDLKYRSCGLLESMVKRSSKSIISDKTTKQSYLEESGKLDMNKIINTCEVMYTVLEMVNTAKIKQLDELYIKDVLDSIK